MTDEDFIGYLLGLTDPDERVAVEAFLAANPDAVAHLDRLRAALVPLEADRDDDPPPAGLAIRTVSRLAAYLVEHEPRTPPQPETSPFDVLGSPPPDADAPTPARRYVPTDRPEPRFVGGRFRADLIVACGIALVTVGLGLSFVNRARHQNEVLACQNNLLTLHQGLTGYADTHGGRFPQVGVEPYPTAGSFVTALVDAGQCPPGFHPTCPAGLPPTVDHGTKPAPTMPVTYAYALGHRTPGGAVLGPRRSDDSADENDLIPISADYPAAATGPTSPHRRGHNVLFAAGNVRFATTPAVGFNGDDIYRNHFGHVAAGVDRTDAVLGLAGDRP